MTTDRKADHEAAKEYAESCENWIDGILVISNLADAYLELAAENAALREPGEAFLQECEKEAAHIEQNGTTLRVKLGEEHEGRCRELCAMYLREFIISYRMRERLAKLEQGEKHG